MEFQAVRQSPSLAASPATSHAPPAAPVSGSSFHHLLAEAGQQAADRPVAVSAAGSVRRMAGAPLVLENFGAPAVNPGQAAVAYGGRRGAEPAARASDWETYRDDQLLSNPGGDAYGPTDEADGFFGRLGRDLSDAAANLGNCFENLLFGADIRYRDGQGKVQTAQRRGLVGSLADFAVDLGSALSFGTWRPDGEDAPQGLEERAAFAFAKLKEALAGDLVGGAAGSINQMGEDLLLAGWNLVEVIPDATLGNFEAGERLVSTIFDNGQVLVDYVTDVLPAGEAWLRVHSADFDEYQGPVFYNLEMPERFGGDARWEYVRNTPLRKAIETIGALLADVVTLRLAGQLPSGSEKRRW